MDRETINAPKINAPKPSDYLEDLASEALSESQKVELLETLFHIMKAFVDVGYGMEPVNKLIEDFEKCAAKSEGLLECKDNQKDTKKGGYYE